MELKHLENLSSAQWDCYISRFGGGAIFQQSVWLDFIEVTQGAKRILFEMKEGGEVTGYFPCFIVKKGPFRILGSPLVGWTTESMGPVATAGFDQKGFLSALEDYCARNKVDQLELSNPAFNPDIFALYGFQHKKRSTFLVRLFSDEEKMRQKLDKKSCRYSIRKAQKNGVIVRETVDRDIVDDYYRQIKEVFRRKRLAPTYPLFRVQALFDCLGKNHMFSLEVVYDGKRIASGFFPYDKHRVYFWGGASEDRFNHLCPNEMLHWTAMILAGKKGIFSYDMGGVSPFKSKFGGEPLPVYHWYKSYNPLAKIARLAYQAQFRLAQKAKGFVSRL